MLITYKDVRDLRDLGELFIRASECIDYTINTRSSKTCDSCGVEGCKYRIRDDKDVRINCPMWEVKKDVS